MSKETRELRLSFFDTKTSAIGAIPGRQNVLVVPQNSFQKEGAQCQILVRDLVRGGALLRQNTLGLFDPRGLFGRAKEVEDYLATLERDITCAFTVRMGGRCSFHGVYRG